jgi:AraC-like DNA-binding protein
MAVVAVLPDATLRARLLGALRGRVAALTFCDGAVEALAGLAAGARALVVGTTDARGCPTAPLVERVRRDHPSATVIAYCALTRGGATGRGSGLVDLVRAGAHGIFIRDVDDDPHALRAALRVAEETCAADLVLGVVGASLPTSVRSLVALYLRAGERSPGVAEAARALGVHRRTLVNRLRAAGCPAPRALRTWCRVFIAARMLEEPGRTVESVALQLDFDSPSGLRNTLRRYTGHAPAALRAAGGLPVALSAFTEACAARRAADADRPPRARRRAPEHPPDVASDASDGATGAVSNPGSAPAAADALAGIAAGRTGTTGKWATA